MKAPARRARGPQGFVLVLVLLMLGMASVGSIAILISGREGLTETSALEGSARMRALANAGTARAAYAMRVSGDPLKVFAAREGHPIVWKFDGAEIELFSASESGKIDLNAGHGDLVAAMLSASAMDDATVSAVTQAVSEARSERRILPSVRSALEPCRRFTHDARALERHFTVLTGLNGITPTRDSDGGLSFIPQITAAEKDLVRASLENGRSPLDDRRLTRLRPYLADGVPVYTLYARPRLQPVARDLGEQRSVFMLSVRAPHLRLVGTEWNGPAAERDFC